MQEKRRYDTSLVQIEQARSISSLLYEQKYCECSVKTQQFGVSSPPCSSCELTQTKMADVFPFVKYLPFSWNLNISTQIESFNSFCLI